MQLINESDIDPKVWKRIKWVFLSLLLAVLLGVLFFEQSKGNCSEYYDYINQSYRGRVVEKYLDSNNHMRATIKLDDERIHVINPFDETAYFDSIEIGDRVLKNNGSLKYVIHKKNDTLVFETRVEDCMKFLEK